MYILTDRYQCYRGTCCLHLQSPELEAVVLYSKFCLAIILHDIESQETNFNTGCHESLSIAFRNSARICHVQIPLIVTLQSMEATKALLRHTLRAKLEAALDSEVPLLVQHWISMECQTNFRRFLDDEDIGLQRQRLDP